MTETSYYMRGYILDNGRALARTLLETEADILAVAGEAQRRGCRRVILSGFGSSFTAACAAKPAFDRFVDMPTLVLPTNELRYYPELVNEEALVAILSRSGERKWVIDGMAFADERNALTVAITGARDSLMAERASTTILTTEGPEITFPKTKSVTAGVGLFLSLALHLSRSPEAVQLRKKLATVPADVETTLAAVDAQIPGLISRLETIDRVIVGGTGGNAGTAMEFALTLQEAALVTTEWSDTGNLFHGPLCALDERWLIVLMVTEDDVDVSSDTVELVRALGGRSLALIPAGIELRVAPDETLRMPQSSERVFWPLVYLPVLQLLTYEWAVSRGINPDAPPGSEIIIEALVPTGRQEPEARMAASQ